MGMESEDKLMDKPILTLYYQYVGNTQWFKEEFLAKKYNVLKYLLPVKDKEDSNFIIQVYLDPNNDKNKLVSFHIQEKVFHLFSVNKTLGEKLVFSQEQFSKLFDFLKETFIEKED